MNNNYPITVQQIHDATNNGLDVFCRYVNIPAGAENCKKKFKYRESDSTASAKLSIKDGIYFLVDFGGKSFSAISVVMDLFGLEFGDAIKKIAADFNIQSAAAAFYKPEKDFTATDLDKDHFHIEFKPFQNLEVIGRFVADIADNLGEYNFYEVDYYEKVIYSEVKGAKLVRTTATKEYPIFAYTPDKTKWVKLYEPRAPKFDVDADGKKHYLLKHSYLGKKPERYIHGLERLLEMVDTDYVKELKSKIFTTKDKGVKEAYQEELDEIMLDEIFVCTGGTDSLCHASLDFDRYNVIWFNSESEQLTPNEYYLLSLIAKNIYLIPDLDLAGVQYGKEVAEKIWQLKSIWLPKDKMTKNGKDLRDWQAFYRSSNKEGIVKQFDNLKNGALKCCFFDQKVGSRGDNPYKINLSNLHYFLNVKNFYSYKIQHKHVDIASEEQRVFIKIAGNIVEKTYPQDIRKFCENYLRDKGQPLEVINMVKSSPYFNENHLLSLDSIELNFKNFDADTQIYFFKNQVAKITANGVTFHKHGTAKNYAWEKSIVQHNIMPESPFFEHYKDEIGNDRIKILRGDCEYMNYLINASRIYWRKDLEEPFKNDVDKQKYHEENRFNLNGSNLSLDHHLTQEKHFLNKCFALGYMLHKYKREDYAKMLYMMDDTIKESDDDANGRSGKSLMLRGLRQLLANRFLIDGKNKTITTDKHIFHGLDENSGFIEIEDADKHLDFKFFYTKITTGVVVNPKNSKPHELDFEDVPKMALTTNYGLANIKGSDIGRLLFVSFSDYYHEKTDAYLEQRKVSHDFGNRTLFQTWDNKQWNVFYNFLLYCCQLYLQNIAKEFQAPQDNISINNIKAGIGDSFMEWANGYFHEDTLNVKITRKEMFNDYKDVAGKYSKTPQMFKKALEGYCKLHQWVFNPAEVQGKDGRIKETVFDSKKQKNTTEECFYIKATEMIKPVAPDLTEEEIQTEFVF